MRDLALINRQSVPKEIYAFCRAVGNRYGKTADDTMAAEVESIKLLTADINPEVLKIMCAEAVKHFPKDKARYTYQQFDINYIMTFFQSSDYLHRNGFNGWVEWEEDHRVHDFVEVANEV